MYYYPVETRLTPLARVRRERLLPASGEVSVTQGQPVEPSDVIASCWLPGRTHIVDMSRALRVPPERAAECQVKEIGAMVQNGDCLAAPRGLSKVFGRGCTAPASGQIIDVRNGLVVIESTPTTFELCAGYRGQVVEVLPGKGAAISTVCALIQGMWGSGGEAAGVLEVLTENRDQQLRAEQINAGSSGSLVVAGRIVDGEGLEEASRSGVRGMIVGGVDASLRKRLRSLPYPVLVVGGFGAPSISEQAFALLQSNVGREAMLSADSRAHHRPLRPEVLIPVSYEGDGPAGEQGCQPLQIGMQVRGLRTPYDGAMGRVTGLPAQPQVVESGLRVPVAEVELFADGQVVRIPLVNLEWTH